MYSDHLSLCIVNVQIVTFDADEGFLLDAYRSATFYFQEETNDIKVDSGKALH